MLRLPNKNDAKHVARSAAYIGFACLVAVLIWSFRWTVRGPVFEVPRVIAQNVYRQQCPQPTTPVVSLYFGLADGSLVQWACLDTVYGNLVIDNQIYVALPNFTSSKTIGDQINAAYGMCPLPNPQGRTICKIILSQPTNGNCLVSNTPISFSVLGKPVWLAGNGTCLDYSGMTSGSAITYDFGQGFTQQWGLSNLKLLGPCTTTSCIGATTVGLNLGPSNGAVGGIIENFQVSGPGINQGFAVGIQGGSLQWFVQCTACQIESSAIGVKFTAGGESDLFIGGALAQNAIGLDTSNSGSNIGFVGTSFDDNTTTDYNRESSTTFSVIFHDCHFENAGLGDINVITDNQSQGLVEYIGGMVQNDAGSGTLATLFNMASAPGNNSAELKTIGFQIQSGGQTVTNVAQLGNGTYDLDFIYTGAMPANSFNSTLTGAYRICTSSGSSSFRNCQTGGGITGVATKPLTVATLPSASSVPSGTSIVVTDATTFTVGACVGGGADTMLAVSNGATWSCH